MNRQHKKNKSGKLIVAETYFHGITHRLKKSQAGKGFVFFVLPAPNKAYWKCGKVNRDESITREKCDTTHTTRYTQCQEEVAYDIPLACEKYYISQTSVCINDWTREQAASLKNLVTTGKHRSRLPCMPMGIKNVRLSHRGRHRY